VPTTKRSSKFLARSAVAPALVALIIGIGFTSARLAHFDGDPSRFVVAGDKYANPAEVPAELHVQRNSTGYDGQFFYRLSRAPFRRERTDFGITFDAAPARQQRIAYPLVVWALHRLGIGSVPWLLIIVNLACYAGLGLVAALIARDLKRSPWWALVVPLYPGFIVTTALDLAETLSALLLLIGVRSLMGKRWGLAAIAFTAAALTRETTLIVPGGLLVASLLQRHSTGSQRERPAVPRFVFLVPIAIVFSWECFLWSWWRTHPLFSAGRQFSFPFYSAAHQLWTWLSHHSAEDLFQLMEFVLLTILVIRGVQVLSRSKVTANLRIPLVLAAVFMTTFPAELWLSQTNFLRASVEPAMLSLLVLLEAAPESLPMIGMATAMFGLANMAIWAGVGGLSR
jgi:hypothetical protein